jgi:hypothetical protein
MRGAASRTKPNGQTRPPPGATLSPTEQQRLNFLRETGAAADSGVRAEVLADAVAGATLPPRIIGRLREFVAH